MKYSNETVCIFCIFETATTVVQRSSAVSVNLFFAPRSQRSSFALAPPAGIPTPQRSNAQTIPPLPMTPHTAQSPASNLQRPVSLRRRRSAAELTANRQAIKGKPVVLVLQREPAALLCEDLDVTACRARLGRSRQLGCESASEGLEKRKGWLENVGHRGSVEQGRLQC